MDKIVYVDGVKGYATGESEDDEILVYYDDWADEQGYKRMEDLRTELHESGCSEEEFDSVIEEAEEEFEQWCEDNGVTGEYV